MTFVIVVSVLNKAEKLLSHAHRIGIATSLEETLNAIKHDIVNYQSEKDIYKIHYMIYTATTIQLKTEEDFYSQGTDYYLNYIKDGSHARIDNLNFVGLEFKGKAIKEFESYKVLGFNNITEFYDRVIEETETTFGLSKTDVSYADLDRDDLAKSYLKDGRIDNARDIIEHAVLEYHE